MLNRGHKHVTLKVCERNSTQAAREVAVYKHLNTIKTSHAGRSLVRKLLDAFEIDGSDGSHQCLVHQPLGMSLSDLRVICPGRKLPELLFKMALYHILLALDFLHTEARVIHTGRLTHAELPPISVCLPVASHTNACSRRSTK